MLNAGAMDLLMVASELGPYVRVTDAADSVASLSKALRQLGHEVTVCLPRHPGFEQHGLLLARRLTPLSSPSGEEITVLDGQLASGVRLILLDRPGLFEDSDTPGGLWSPVDEARRYGWFSQAVAAVVTQRSSQGQGFDLVHAHNWQGSLAAVAIRRLPQIELPVVLTVHDWCAQGAFAVSQGADLGLAEDLLEQGELQGQLNALKAGLLGADVLATISQAAFTEFVNAGDPLGSWVSSRAMTAVGVANGVDYAVYNPAIDPLIVSRYDAEDVSNKGCSKSELLRQLGLELEPARPLVVATGELTVSQGFDVLVGALPGVMRNDLSLVVAGRGDQTIEEGLAEQVQRQANALAWVQDPDETLAHRLLAAADLLLVPSRYEPAGSTVLRAARYGAVPVAHATGAVRDLVVDADAKLETGTGFLYDEATVTALRATLQRGLAAYASPAWPSLRRRVMRQDVGWDRPARRYQQLYRQAIAARGA